MGESSPFGGFLNTVLRPMGPRPIESSRGSSVVDPIMGPLPGEPGGDFGPGGNSIDDLSPNSLEFAPGNPGLWTPGPGARQTYHPFSMATNPANPDATGWFRQSPPQLFWPNRDVNQFPVWPYPGPPPPDGPPVVPPPGGGNPPPGGTVPPGYPPGTTPAVAASYPPWAFGPNPGPSTGAGGDTGEGSPSSGGGFGLGGFSISPNFSGRGISFGGALGQGLDALGLGPVGSTLGNMAISVLGGPLAGIANATLGGVIGGVRGYNAMQNLSLLSMLARAPRSSGVDTSSDPTTDVNMSLVDEGIGMTSGQPGVDATGGGTGPSGAGGPSGNPSGDPSGESASGGATGGGGSSASGGGGDSDSGDGPGPGFHKGGLIPNRGISQLETVPIKAKEGEFVIRPEAARKFAPILEWINNAPSQASPEHLIRLIAMAKTMDQRRGQSA